MNRFTTRRLFALLAAAILLHPLGSLAQGVDFMTMVDQYGQNVVNTLHTEIMNDAGRNAMKQATGGKSRSRSTPIPSWPTHITTSRVANHVFSIEELAAMYGNNHDRAKQLLDGRNITVSGVVVLPERDKGSSFRLKSSNGSNYGVWVYYGSTRRPASVKNGMYVSIQGEASSERRSYLTIRSPSIVNSTTQVPPAAVTDAADISSKSTAADNKQLLFVRSAILTKKMNEQLATSLAPLLKKGNAKQDLLNILNRGELQQQFENVLATHRFSAQDIGDVLAASVILNWQVANRHDNDPSRAGIQAVRDKMRSTLTAHGKFTDVANSQKQMLADFVSTSSLIIASRYQYGKQHHDSEAIAQASDDAQGLVKALLGIDLRQFALTDNGLMAK